MPLLLILLAVSELWCMNLVPRNIFLVGNGFGLHTYSREFLLSLRNRGDTPPKHLPEDIRSKPGSDRSGRRIRGKRGGVRQRLRRRVNNPPLPTMILSNVRSLRNKMDELRSLSSHCHEFREACIMVLTESWLRRDIPNDLIQLDGFSCVRADREATSGKSRGGGICVYVKDSWCSQFTIRETICDPDIEALCLTMRPYYLPREFGSVSICAAYVPPGAKANVAANRLADCVYSQLQ